MRNMDLKNFTTNSLLRSYTNPPTYRLIIWGVVDSILILAILTGNILTICAVKWSRKLSAVLSNQFIFSLAISDIMVAISFPYHFAFFIVETLSTTRELCLLRFVFILLACSSSMSNLLGIATDRYIAIVYPLHYSRYMTKKVAVIIILTVWILAFAVSSVPIFWNTWKLENECTLLQVLAPEYVNFIICPMFASIWISMLLVYIRIWREATGHARRLRRSTRYQYGKNFNDSKSVQVVLLILGCFSICWLPFYLLIIVIKLESPIVYEITLRMAIANSCMNPIIYAWKNSNFRKIFWCLVHCETPNALNYNSSFITNHIPNKRKTIKNREEEISKQNDVYVIKTCDIENELNELQYSSIQFTKTNENCENEKESSINTACTSVSSSHKF